MESQIQSAIPVIFSGWELFCDQWKSISKQIYPYNSLIKIVKNVSWIFFLSFFFLPFLQDRIISLVLFSRSLKNCNGSSPISKAMKRNAKNDISTDDKEVMVAVQEQDKDIGRIVVNANEASKKKKNFLCTMPSPKKLVKICWLLLSTEGGFFWNVYRVELLIHSLCNIFHI